MLGLKLNHVSKRGHWYDAIDTDEQTSTAAHKTCGSQAGHAAMMFTYRFFDLSCDVSDDDEQHEHIWKNPGITDDLCHFGTMSWGNALYHDFVLSEAFFSWYHKHIFQPLNT